MSGITTYMGPVWSLRTNNANQNVPHLYLDSNTTLSADGIADFTGATYLSPSTTTTTIATGTISDNELSVHSVDGLAAALRFRSGNTVYTWDSSSTATVA